MDAASSPRPKLSVSCSGVKLRSTTAVGKTPSVLATALAPRSWSHTTSVCGGACRRGDTPVHRLPQCVKVWFRAHEIKKAVHSTNLHCLTETHGRQGRHLSSDERVIERGQQRE